MIDEVVLKEITQEQVRSIAKVCSDQGLTFKQTMAIAHVVQASTQTAFVKMAELVRVELEEDV